MEKIIFSADVHGNMQQYQRILNHAQNTQTDLVIFGGDLTPKAPERRTPEKQKAFLEGELFPLLGQFHRAAGISVLFIMGNDDFKSNHDVMTAGQDLYGYRMIDQTPYVSKAGYIFVGYTPVPFTPFQYKCWERRDLAEDTGIGDRHDARLEGVISRNNELKPYHLNDAFAKPSIAEDLAALTKGIEKDKMILISHAPPFGTVCDMNHDRNHIGSKAVRAFIEESQPYATMHGHIHETVEISGSFAEQIGRTSCIAVGNDNRPDTPYIIEAILDDRPQLSRLKL